MGSREFIKNSTGFTLIEHLIAIVITAILVTVAVPGYTQYLRRGWVLDGTQALAVYAQRLETSYESNGNYGIAGCSVAAPGATEQWSFNCALDVGGQGFVARVVGVGVMAGYTFTLDELGNRVTTAFPSVAGTRTCWLVQGTEC
jgi:type IV pilus assembly protein PilE